MKFPKTLSQWLDAITDNVYLLFLAYSIFYGFTGNYRAAYDAMIMTVLFLILKKVNKKGG